MNGQDWSRLYVVALLLSVAVARTKGQQKPEPTLADWKVRVMEGIE